MKGFFASSSVQQKTPRNALVPRCGACGLYRNCATPKMEPYGKGRRDVLVVGEAPGSTEDEEGRPFIGKAGQHFRQALSAQGFNLDKDAITTNALICRPPDNKIKDVRMIDYCRPNLTNTLTRVEPRVVVALGRTALASVLGPFWNGDVGPMERWVGWKMPLGKFWVCPTWHPSYLLRQKSELMDRLFAQHLKEAFEIQERPPVPLPIAIEAILDDEMAAERIKQVEETGGWVAVDYETNCLKPELPKARIVSCAISNGEITIAYPWHGKAIEATSKMWQNPHVYKIASNLKFEDRWTRHFLKHRVVHWGWDTMLATHCLDNRPGICSLKFQAFIHLGINTYNENIEPYLENYKGHYNRIQEIALPDLLRYNGMDALLEHRLMCLQREQMGYGHEAP